MSLADPTDAEFDSFGNDANGRVVGGEFDLVDLVETVLYLGVQRNSSFTGRLGMKLCREAKLEENILHDV